MKKLIIACLAATAALALLSACTTVKDGQPAPFMGDTSPGTTSAHITADPHLGMGQ
jgi:hypothetical protein